MKTKSLKSKRIFIIIMLASITTFFSGFMSLVFSKSSLVAAPGTKAMKSVYDLNLTLNNGEIISLENFKGKKILFVNVASKCGYTSQYSKLQELYELNSERLEIIAIPCNDFGKQEPGNAEEIKEFCSLNYGITFTIAAKQNIKSLPKSELYDWLSEPSQNGWNSELPSWNFCKYLLDENGELTYYFKSNVSPLGEKISSVI